MTTATRRAVIEQCAEFSAACLAAGTLNEYSAHGIRKMSEALAQHISNGTLPEPKVTMDGLTYLTFEFDRDDIFLCVSFGPTPRTKSGYVVHVSCRSTEDDEWYKFFHEADGDTDISLAIDAGVTTFNKSRA